MVDGARSPWCLQEGTCAGQVETRYRWSRLQIWHGAGGRCKREHRYAAGVNEITAVQWRCKDGGRDCSEPEDVCNELEEEIEGL